MTETQTATTATTATIDDVKHVAELAHLELTADEQQRMMKDLNAILGHIAELGEVDTANVQPMAAGIPELEAATGDSGNSGDSKDALREDMVRPSLDRAPVMAAAPETDGVFFKVPKVIER
jgi:aspartyl-tRNA(Asn)/glutamyl-tRNA(Gln) amidotransferase subunit C